jgi:hypothetical protein
MTKWEYKISQHAHLNWLKEGIRSDGKEGWELITVVESQGSGNWTAFLKRKLGLKQ